MKLPESITQPNRNMRYDGTLLAFDFGTSHVGVAVGQTITCTATPLTTIRGRGTGPDWEAIGELISTWRPCALVVGEPVNMDGSVQPMTKKALRFSRQLQGRFRLPVLLTDERLSSREARSRMPPGSDLYNDHAIAAQVILETWFGTAFVRGNGGENRL